MQSVVPIAPAGLRDELRTGIEDIDRERRKLFEMIDELCERFDRTPATGAISGNFAAIYAQASAQFAAEETLMRDLSHANYRAHKDEHDRLLALIRGVTAAYEDGECALCGTNLRDCLAVRLIDHMRKTDAELAVPAH